MGLHGQEGERGYAMAALLVTLAIMAIMMSVAMPVWRQEARREKEADLVWRGEQYARAIALFRNKNQGNFPPSIDVLVSGRYLRKKFKDPMTKDGEFQIMPVGVATTPGSPTPQQPQQGVSGIMGVRSKSTENSLRSYRGQTRYDQWAFRFDVVPIGRGSQPNAPDGRANPPGGRGPRGAGPRGSGPGGSSNPGVDSPGNPGTGFPPQFPPGGSRGTAPGGRGPGAPGGTGPGGRGFGRGPGL
jgi:type II secretory pathway pseudopilin PulG